MSKANRHLAFGIVFAAGAVVLVAMFLWLRPTAGWWGLAQVAMCVIFGYINLRAAFRLRRDERAE